MSETENNTKNSRFPFRKKEIKRQNLLNYRRTLFGYNIMDNKKIVRQTVCCIKQAPLKRSNFRENNL